MYIGPKSRTERLRKTKIGTEVAHVARDSNTTLRSKGRSKVNLQEMGAYCGGLPHSLFIVHKAVNTCTMIKKHKNNNSVTA